MKDVILISGPTASGKTTFAINLVRFLQERFKIESEIINADSVQIYKDLKIISAQPNPEELSSAKHHLFGILGPHESNSVSSWMRLAAEEIRSISSENKIAILCGGTGLYLKTILNGISEIPKIPAEFRRAVAEKFEELGREKFFDELCALDSHSREKLHKNDTQRILRAYEVVSYTGKALHEWWESGCANQKYNVVAFFVLAPEKTALHARAFLRIQNMLAGGAIEEVRNFNEKHAMYSGPLQKVIGYREISKLLKNNSTDAHQQCIEEMFLNTKHYIKRQMTWARHQFQDAKFIDACGEDIHETDIQNLATFMVQSHAKKA